MNIVTNINTFYANQKDLIGKCINIYKSIIDYENIKTKNYLKQISDYIQRKYNNIYEELHNIAKVTSINFEDILLINCRSELMILSPKKKPIQECSTIVSTEHFLLGQNRDFLEDFKDIVNLNVFCDKKIKYAIFQEPGILGKIGMNEYGICIGLNFVKGDFSDIGLPIHILMREILLCQNMIEVKKIIQGEQKGKCGALTVIDSFGNVLAVEFNKDRVFFVDNNYDTGFFRTNHFISKTLLSEFPFYNKTGSEFLGESTRIRYDQIQKLLSSRNMVDISTLKRILNNKKNGENAIYCKYKFSKNIQKNIGTIFSVIFDAKNKSILYKKAGDKKYSQVSFF